jgi:hypothetical protein
MIGERLEKKDVVTYYPNFLSNVGGGGNLLHFISSDT